MVLKPNVCQLNVLANFGTTVDRLGRITVTDLHLGYNYEQTLSGLEMQCVGSSGV